MEKESAHLTKEARDSQSNKSPGQRGNSSEADSCSPKLLKRRQDLETDNTAGIKRISNILEDVPSGSSHGDGGKQTEIIPLWVIQQKVRDNDFFSSSEPESPEAIMMDISKFERSIDTELLQIGKENTDIDKEIAGIEATRNAKKTEINVGNKTNVLIRKLKSIMDYGKRKRVSKEITGLEVDLSKTKIMKSSLETKAKERREIRERLEERKGELFVSMVKKAAESIKKGCIEFGEQIPKDPALIEQFNEDLLHQKIIPVINKLKEEGKVSQEQIDEYVSILKTHFKEGRTNYHKDDKEVIERKKERAERWYDLNMEMGSSQEFEQVKYSLNLRNLNYFNPEAGYNEMFALLSIHDAYQELKKLSRVVETSKSSFISKELREKAIEKVKKFIYPINDDGKPSNGEEMEDYQKDYCLKEKVPLDLELIKKSIFGKHFLPWETKSRWDAVKNNDEISQIYKLKEWKSLEEKLADVSIKHLMITEEGTGQSIELADRMLWLAKENPDLKAKLAPFIVMDAWREPEPSGTFYFLNHTVSSYKPSSDSRLYEFINTINDKDLALLDAQNLPGVTQIIRTIRSNPDNFSFTSVDNPQWTSLVKKYAQNYNKSIEEATRELRKKDEGLEKSDENLITILKELNLEPSILDRNNRRIRNPVYEQIQEELKKMCLDFLQSGDEAKQFFTLGLLKRLRVDLGSGYKILGDNLKNTKNKPLQEETLNTLVRRADPDFQNDINASLVLLEAFPSLSEDTKEKVTRKYAPKLLSEFINNEQVLPKHIDLMARALDRSPHDIELTINFIKEIKKRPGNSYIDPYYQEYHKKKLGDFIILANKPEVLDFIKQFPDFHFDIDQASTFLDMIPHREEVLETISEIKAILPHYEYQFRHENIFDPETNKEQYKINYDPFASLISSGTNEGLYVLPKIEKVIDALDKTQKEKGSFSKRLSDGILRRLRVIDPVLKHFPEKRKTVTSEAEDKFYDSLARMTKALSTADGELKDFRSFYTNSYALEHIARQPEKIDEILSLPSQHPAFFKLIDQGGPLYSNKELIIKDIFSNGNAAGRLSEIESVFSKKVPYWEQLYQFTETRIGDELANAKSEYPITMIGEDLLENLINQYKNEKQQNPENMAKLESIIDSARNDLIDKLIKGEITSIPFNALTGQYKRLVFKDYLKRTIEASRNEEAKAMTDSRNRLNTESVLKIASGTYLHGSPVDVAESVLLSGNLPKEALGEGAATDSYPFQVDFSVISQDLITSGKDLEGIIESTIAKSYGQDGSLGKNGQIFYLYDRTNTTYERGKQYGPNQEHALILGGMPATEISGIILRNSESTLSQVKRAVLENGFYIPVYDIKGNLLFPPEEYDEARLNYNLSIPVEVWDYSLKTGEQRGSNPGGEFTVPSEKGPIPYYVKFASTDQLDRLWNEQLADNIYRFLGYFVPNTKIVKVEGSYGHASELLPIDSQVNASELSKGFLIDAMLANWDIINSGNIGNSHGKLARMDNGGAFLFRARGERKTDFGVTVTELETMRNGYPGLSESDIQDQLKLLKERFTDKEVEQLVDSVRLRRDDRDHLKTTLKQRRDYILSYYSEAKAPSDQEEITEQRKIIESELRKEELNDSVISEIIPEWPKLLGEEGYQHNGVLLGQHIKDCLAVVKQLPEYMSLSDKEKNLALISALFHDFGKPTARKDQNVPRDFEHEIPSAQSAADYMKKFGYSDSDIRTVVRVIINDGIVSDIARGKVRDPRKNLTPEQFKEIVGGNLSVIRILKAVNHADVTGTVGVNGFALIEKAYNQYFEELEKLGSETSAKNE